jgi:drug/metabolite transporter (DMT)-like permease
MMTAVLQSGQDESGQDESGEDEGSEAMLVGDTTAQADRPAMCEVEETAASGIRAEWLVLGSVLLAATGQLMIKMGLNHHLSAAGGPLLTRSLGAIASGLMVYGLGTLLWIEAVRKRDISYLYPLSAINYTLVALGGMFFLGEGVSKMRWMGIAIISMGVALMMSPHDEVKP